MKLDSSTVSGGRQRGGSSDDSRADRVDTAVNRPQLGYNKGEPLVDGYDYADYPSREDLSNPRYGDFLEELADHRLVGNTADMVAELTGASNDTHLRNFLEAVETACRYQDIDTTALQTEDYPNQLDTILGYEVADSAVNKDNAVLMAELYDIGCSVEEIVDVMDSACQKPVSSNKVRNSLGRCGLLDGFEDDSNSLTDSRGEINRPSEGGGLTVDVSDF